MRTEGLAKLLAWLSPSFPVGSFAYSHGLEAAIEEGLVHDRATLQAWIADLLAHGSAQADAIFFRHAHAAVLGNSKPGYVEVAEIAAAMRGTGELALEATQQGESFFSAIADAWPVDVKGWRDALAAAAIRPAFPVSVACAVASAAIPVDDALCAYLHAFAANLVSAAVRAIPLGQTDGQRALAGLESDVDAAVAASIGRSLDEAGAATIAVDALSFRHEVQYSRIFRS